MSRILILDDDADIRHTLREMLTHAGHDIREASDGDAGLRMVRQFHPEIVVTDIFMPERDGLEVIRAVKRDFPTVKIVAISGGGRYGELSYLEMSKTFGADGLLLKPFTRRDVLAVMQHVSAPREELG